MFTCPFGKNLVKPAIDDARLPSSLRSRGPGWPRRICRLHRMSVRFSVRFTSVVSAASLVVSACQGAGSSRGGGGADAPLSAPRGGVASPVDIEAEVQQLRDAAQTLSNSAPFGSLTGGASVDGSGRARFSMPIEVPPGINGLTPSLGLSYSSAAPNGPVGLGFSISGLATMARCRDNIADDGAISEIEFDGEDALCFNGQRLTLVSGVYGEPGSEYRTVRDPRSKSCVSARKSSRRSSAALRRWRTAGFAG